MMHDKEFYRAALNEMKPYIKITCYCDDLGIHKGNLSRFMKDPYHHELMKLSALENLYNTIISSLNSFVK